MKHWIVLTALISGCVGAAAAKLIVPPARAQNALRWEYFCVEGDTGSDLVDTLNQAGREGWELAAAGAGTRNNLPNGWCFKRPLP